MPAYSPALALVTAVMVLLDICKALRNQAKLLRKCIRVVEDSRTEVETNRD